MRNISISIAPESEVLLPFAEDIIGSAGIAVGKASRILDQGDVSILIENIPRRTIPEIGIRGFVPDPNTILVYLDSGHPNFPQKIEGLIISTVTHEFHHAVRTRKIPWATDTLLGAFVTEGLADHFDIELNGGILPLWSLALSESELMRVYRKAEPYFDSTQYNYDDWFFGSGEIPRWAGYALGYRIVDVYMLGTRKKASELVYTKAEEFL